MLLVYLSFIFLNLFFINIYIYIYIYIYIHTYIYTHTQTQTHIFFFLFFFTDQPEIITHPKNVTIEERLLMTLFCNATGNPLPTISWTKDGSPLTKTQGIIFTGENETLSIANITRSESGNYRCVTRNSLGNDTSNAAKVDVLCKCSINYFLFCLISKENFY